MSRLFYHVMQDNVGNLLFDVSGTMRVAGSATLATIYGDEALTVILPNPMTNHPSFGSFKCFLGVGDYDFHMAKAGYTFETLTGVQGYGTLAQQNAHAVVITGGGIEGLTNLGVTGATTLSGLVGIGRSVDAGNRLAIAGRSLFQGDVEMTGTGQFARVGLGRPPDATHVLALSGSTLLQGRVGVNGAPLPNSYVNVEFAKNTGYGLVLRQSDTDAGTGAAIAFLNLATSIVGTITTTGAATAYNTASDGRLKEAVAALPDALATVLALRPVAFKWKSTGEVGEGFIAQEVREVIPRAVTGTPDDPEPTMQMDLSKLVPHLVGAVKELAQQVQTLTAQLTATERRLEQAGA